MTARTIPSTGWDAATQAGDRDRRLAMSRSWKQCLVGGFALATAVVLGSTMAATSVRADPGWSWEGAVVGSVIGGLIGAAIGEGPGRPGTVRFSTTVGTFHDGPFVIHRHGSGWHQRPWHHQRRWHGWRIHVPHRYVHPQRYHHRQWHAPRVHLKPWRVHPQRQLHRQWHSQQFHRQSRQVQLQHHQHRNWHSQRGQQQPRHVQPRQHGHRHHHNW